jgi:type VI secretion system secreted protein Hcp
MALDDIFLKIETKQQGPIKGESADKSHQGEIDVLSWSWGMKGNVNAFAEVTGRSTVQEMQILKRIDLSSTALMSALRNNDEIKKATLVVRKAGGANPLEYLKIIMEKARVTFVELRGGDHGAEPPGILEEIRIGFQKIAVEYQAQAGVGGSKGTTSFETEVLPPA